jgi:hypothetical protein
MIDSATMLQVLKVWLQSWGNLVLTAAIALATVMQWFVSRRLGQLQERIEQNAERVEVYPVLKPAIISNRWHPVLYVANLSAQGVWVSHLVIEISDLTYERAHHPDLRTTQQVNELIPPYAAIEIKVGIAVMEKVNYQSGQYSCELAGQVHYRACAKEHTRSFDPRKFFMERDHL